ncbi:MAG: hypothetical protein ACO2O6_01330 [Candidatus Hydrothermia bacterium]|jgi:hypothetical protein
MTDTALENEIQTNNESQLNKIDELLESLKIDEEVEDKTEEIEKIKQETQKIKQELEEEIEISYLAKIISEIYFTSLDFFAIFYARLRFKAELDEKIKFEASFKKRFENTIERILRKYKISDKFSEEFLLVILIIISIANVIIKIESNADYLKAKAQAKNEIIQGKIENLKQNKTTKKRYYY